MTGKRTAPALAALVLGWIWLGLGVLDVLLVATGPGASAYLPAALVVNALVFGIPGALLVVIGYILPRRGPPFVGI